VIIVLNGAWDLRTMLAEYIVQISAAFNVDCIFLCTKSVCDMFLLEPRLFARLLVLMNLATLKLSILSFELLTKLYSCRIFINLLCNVMQLRGEKILLENTTL
jgi:hypothetical protein